MTLVRSSGFSGTASATPDSGSLGVQRVTNGAVGMPPGSMEAETPSSYLTALEFYSGIGGLRVSLEAAVGAANLRTMLETRVTSFDINTVANSVSRRCKSPRYEKYERMQSTNSLEP